MERDLTIIVEERLFYDFGPIHLTMSIFSSTLVHYLFYRDTYSFTVYTLNRVLFSVNHCLLSVFLARVRKKRAARSIGDDRKFAFKIEQNHAENHSKFPIKETTD